MVTISPYQEIVRQDLTRWMIDKTVNLRDEPIRSDYSLSISLMEAQPGKINALSEMDPSNLQEVAKITEQFWNKHKELLSVTPAEQATTPFIYKATKICSVHFKNGDITQYIFTIRVASPSHLIDYIENVDRNIKLAMTRYFYEVQLLDSIEKANQAVNGKELEFEVKPIKGSFKVVIETQEKAHESEAKETQQGLLGTGGLSVEESQLLAQLQVRKTHLRPMRQARRQIDQAQEKVIAVESSLKKLNQQLENTSLEDTSRAQLLQEKIKLLNAKSNAINEKVSGYQNLINLVRREAQLSGIGELSPSIQKRIKPLSDKCYKYGRVLDTIQQEINLAQEQYNELYRKSCKVKFHAVLKAIFG